MATSSSSSSSGGGEKYEYVHVILLIPSMIAASNRLAYCDWFVNVHNCPYSSIHAPLKIASLVLSTVSVVMVVGYLALRHYHGHRLILSNGRFATADGFLGLLGFAMLLRAIDAGLIVTDTYINYYARYIFMVVAWTTTFQAPVFFLYAITHSIPNAYMNAEGQMVSSLLPPRWLFLGFIVFEMLGVAIGVNGIGIYLGVSYMQHGGLAATSEGYTLLFILWSIFLSFLAIFFWYFGTRLIAVIRDNFSHSGKQSKSSAMNRAVNRMKALIYLTGPFIMSLAVVTIVMAILHQTIFETPAASIFFAVLFHFGVQLGVIVGVIIMTALELLGLLADTSTKGNSSQHNYNGNSGKRIGSASNALSDLKHQGVSKTSIHETLQSIVGDDIEIDEHNQPLSLRVLGL